MGGLQRSMGRAMNMSLVALNKIPGDLVDSSAGYDEQIGTQVLEKEHEQRARSKFRSFCVLRPSKHSQQPEVLQVLLSMEA